MQKYSIGLYYVLSLYEIFILRKTYLSVDCFHLATLAAYNTMQKRT